MYVYYYKRIRDFRLVCTGTYYLIPAPIFLQKSPVNNLNIDIKFISMLRLFTGLFVGLGLGLG